MAQPSLYTPPPRIRGLAAWVAAVLLAATGAQASLESALAVPVERARRAVSSFGVAVMDVDTGEPVYGYGETRELIPASNVKLLTTAAALVALGPGYQFVTPMWARGPILDGVLYGDLAVVGSGDPFLSGHLPAGSHIAQPLAAFRPWVLGLRSMGIERVEGNLLLVDGLFDRTGVHATWPRDQLDRRYEAPVGALSFNDNCVLVRVQPGPPGGAVSVELLPDVGTLVVQNRARTGTAGQSQSLGVGRRPGSNVVEVWGTLPANWAPIERWLTVPDPVTHFGDAVAAALGRAGIALTGDRAAIETLPAGDWYRIGELRNDLLSVVEAVNHRSQNLYAEALLKLLGARVMGDGSWEGGTKAVREILARLGLHDGFQQADGSGMSRDSRMTPQAFARLLVAMAGHEYGGEYLRSLPWGGQPDTTLRNRLRTQPYEANVFAKTGWLRGAAGLSGYAKGRSGRLYAFSILINGSIGYGQAADLADRIVRTLVDEG